MHCADQSAVLLAGKHISKVSCLILMREHHENRERAVLSLGILDVVTVTDCHLQSRITPLIYRRKGTSKQYISMQQMDVVR